MPQINTFLFNVFKSCLKNYVVPIQWRYAREIFIPKCKTPMESNIKDFRPIALLNIEGKLLFSLVSRRLDFRLFLFPENLLKVVHRENLFPRNVS